MASESRATMLSPSTVGSAAIASEPVIAFGSVVTSFKLTRLKVVVAGDGHREDDELLEVRAGEKRGEVSELEEEPTEELSSELEE